MRAIRRVLAGGEIRRLSKHCREQLQDFPLPDPFTLDGLIANIEMARDCSLQLVPVDSSSDLRSACGLRVSVGQTHFILYRPRPTPNQTLNTIFHELTHLWLDHGNDETVSNALRLPDAFLSLLDGTLDTAAVTNARSYFDTDEEQVAELGASFIRSQIREQAGKDLLSLLESSWTHPIAPPGRYRRP